MNSNEFDYIIDDPSAWNPKQRPIAPFGPTIVEIIRSCPLRSCFESSPGYERRTSVSGRIGTALHATLQYISEIPFETMSSEEVATEVSKRFARELNTQHNIATDRPREQSLTWDNNRVERAAEAAIAEAIRIAQTGIKHSSPKPRIVHDSDLHSVETDNSLSTIFSQGETVAVEVSVRSADGLFKGRIDRAERTADGIRLIDYKSAMREDLPERYERQLQLYSFMWHDSFGEWPIDAQVYYPLRGTFFTVDISPSVCQNVASDSAALIDRLLGSDQLISLATPGDVCKVCEFRPWCKPFWNSQVKEKKHMRALEMAALGFEGTIDSIKLEKHYWRLTVTWRNAIIKLIAPQERFPHLAVAQSGQMIRVLDAPLRGQLYEPSAHVSEYTEIFLLR